jgi:hypothetical protein
MQRHVFCPWGTNHAADDGAWSSFSIEDFPIIQQENDSLVGLKNMRRRSGFAAQVMSTKFLLYFLNERIGMPQVAV